MKKILFYILMAVMLLAFSACGAQEKTDGGAVADTAAQTSEPATDTAVDADTAQTSGAAASDVDWWPDNELGNALPVFAKGSLLNVMDTDNGFIIALEKVESNDYDDYLAIIKDSFSKKGAVANDGDMFTYVGYNKDGVKVSLIYDKNIKTLNISANEE